MATKKRKNYEKNKDNNTAEASQNSNTVSTDANKLSSENLDVDITALPEYYNLIQSEYQIERSKKESFENRAGIIMTFIGVAFAFVIDKAPFYEITSLFTKNLNFILFLKIICGCVSYLSLIIALIASLQTISTRKQENYPVQLIDYSRLNENRKNALARIIFEYREIILAHREKNEKRASRFKRSLILSAVSIISFTIYLSIK